MRVYNLLLNKIDHMLFWIALHQFDPVETLMDIGCGNKPQDFIEVTKRHYTIDPSDVSTDLSKYFHIKGTWEHPAMMMVRNNWVDTVVLMDVVEHIEKNEARRLLKKTQQYVNQIVVFTPLGFMEQNDTENPWNTHRSAWHPEDFGDGWTTEVFRYFHWCDFKGRELPNQNGAILAVWNK